MKTIVLRLNLAAISTFYLPLLCKALVIGRYFFHSAVSQILQKLMTAFGKTGKSCYTLAIDIDSLETYSTPGSQLCGSFTAQVQSAPAELQGTAAALTYISKLISAKELWLASSFSWTGVPNCTGIQVCIGHPVWSVIKPMWCLKNEKMFLEKMDK